MNFGSFQDAQNTAPDPVGFGGYAGTYTDRSDRRRDTGASHFTIAADSDYKMETLQILLEAFKTKMRADFDTTSNTLDKKTRLLRQEVLSYVQDSLEDVEDRLTSHTRGLIHTNQLADIEFRKGLKTEMFVIRSDLDSTARTSNDRLEEVERKLRLTESFYREIKADLEESLAVSSVHKKKSLAQVLDEDLHRSLNGVVTRVDELEITAQKDYGNLRRDTEQKFLEAEGKFVQIHKLMEGVLKEEEQAQAVRDEKMLLLLEDSKLKQQEQLETEVEKVYKLIKDMRIALNSQTEQVDFVTSQFSEFERTRRPVERSELDACERRLLSSLSPALDKVAQLEELFTTATGLSSSGVSLGHARSTSQSKQDTDRIVEEVKKVFLSQYGKQIEETHLEVAALKRQTERVLVDDLDVKRILKESEKRMFDRLDAFEEEERQIRHRRLDQEEMREERDKKTQQEEEQRRAKVDRMLAEWEEDKRRLAEASQSTAEALASEHKRHQRLWEEEVEQLHSRAETARKKAHEREEQLRDELKEVERRFADRFERAEQEWRDREARLVAAAGHGGGEAAHASALDKLRTEVEAEVRERARTDRERLEEMGRKEEKLSRLESQLRRQLAEVSEELKALDKRTDGKVTKLEDSVAATEKKMRREEREYKEEKSRSEQVTRRLDQETGTLRSQLEKLTLECEDREEKRRLGEIDRNEREERRVREAEEAERRNLQREEKREKEWLDSEARILKRLEANANLKRVSAAAAGSGEVMQKDLLGLEKRINSSVGQLAKELAVAEAAISAIKLQVGEHGSSALDMAKVQEVVEAKLGNRKLAVMVDERVRERLQEDRDAQEAAAEAKRAVAGAEAKEADNDNKVQIDRLKEKVEGVMRHVEKFEDSLDSSISHRISDIERAASAAGSSGGKSQTSASEVRELSQRTTELEQRMTKMFRDLEGDVDKKLSDIENQFEVLTGKVSGLPKLNNLVPLINQNMDAISNLEAKVEGLESSGVAPSSHAAATSPVAAPQTSAASPHSPGKTVSAKKKSKKNSATKLASSVAEALGAQQTQQAELEERDRAEKEKKKMEEMKLLLGQQSPSKASSASVEKAPSSTNTSSSSSPRSQAMEFMRAGVTFMRFPVVGKAKPKPKEIYYDHAKRAVCWGEPGARSDSDKSLALVEVTDIFIGKHTNAFSKKQAKKAPNSCCFSIGSSRGTLDLEADSEAVRNRWLSAFKLLIAAQGSPDQALNVFPADAVIPSFSFSLNQSKSSSSRFDTLSDTNNEGDTSNESKRQGSGPPPAYIFIKARDLVNLHAGSTINPLVVLFEYDPVQQQLEYVDQTEWMEATRDPDFVTRVKLSYQETDGTVQLRTSGRFSVYDVEDPAVEVREEDCIGWVDINFQDLLDAPDNDVAYRVVHSDATRNEELLSNNTEMHLRFEPHHQPAPEDEDPSADNSNSNKNSSELNTNKQPKGRSTPSRSSLGLFSDVGTDIDGSPHHSGSDDVSGMSWLQESM